MNMQPLTSIQAEQKLTEFGLNVITNTKQRSVLKMFFAEFTDLMVILLIVASVIAIISGEHIDGGVILFIVVLNAVIGFVQEYRADKAVEALQKLVSPRAHVIRDDQEIFIDAKYVVPGDILVLSEGDRVAADGEILDAKNLKINESILTGESRSVDKKNEDIVYMSTEVTRGVAKVLVKATGMHTEFGKIADLTTNTKKDKSPLEKELFKIGVFVSKVTIVISTLLFLSGVFLQGKEFVDTLLFAMSVAVAAVPEGLPATITIALAIGVQRLAKRNAIVKQLSSVETLGSTTVICSDKTGTLTKNQMTVEEIKMFSDKKEDLDLFYQSMILCNDAKKNESKYIGDETEIALLKKAVDEKYNIEEINKTFGRINEVPFDSERKMMSVIVETGRDLSRCQQNVFSKGAVEKILALSNYILENGEKKIFDKNKKEEILKLNEQMSSKALRVLGIAYKESNNSDANIESDLIFIGLVGLMDPPREEVAMAIENAKKAGIKINIVTGDHSLTAKAIAEKIGLNAKYIISGEELDKMNNLTLRKILEEHGSIIFARVNPEDKLKIVNVLKENGEIVAVTGDGVNDAPALKRADIGIAMGITGTDVSKEASNMVLADDSFASIVNAIEEGRKIYENLKKFVFYTFSCNIGELTTVFAAIIFQFPAPLTAILILCVDLGTDVLPAVALAMEDSEPGIMNNPPRNPNTRIMTKAFTLHFVLLGLFIGVAVLLVFFDELRSYGYVFGKELDSTSIAYMKASTSAFVMLVMIQMVNAINCRSLRNSVFKLGLFANKYLFFAIFTSIVFAILVTEVPLINKYIGTVPLDKFEWGTIILASLSIFIVEEVRKLVFFYKK